MSQLPKALDQMKVGDDATVVAVNAKQSDLLSRLLTLGIVEGAKIRVTQRGLFGSPINIQVLGSVLSLRRSEAAAIQVA